MSDYFSDEEHRLLLEEAVRIAVDYLDRAGEIDDLGETYQFLIDRVGFMIAKGQHSRLLLSNRAIAAYQRHRQAQTLELSLVS
jgi:hypothetical protein